MLSNKTFEKISSIGKKHWDECANNENPFLSYTFLKNLEDSKSIGPGTSWMAKYLCIFIFDSLFFLVYFIPGGLSIDRLAAVI